MKQILQSLKTGATEVADVPCPAVQRGQLLIRSTHTLISAGTERMLVEFGKAGWIDKARQQPDKVRMVLDKIRTDGLLPTLEAVFNKLDQPLPLGYCNVGVVLEVGAGRRRLRRGRSGGHQRQARRGGQRPANLCARIPDAVSDEAAAFTVLGADRACRASAWSKPTLGEAVVVTGLGLIGLLAVQLLRAQGCRVLGIDFDPARLALARSFGAEAVNLAAGEDPVLAAAQAFSRGRGVDAVLITASTKSSEPVHQAAQMCRQRGRIVLVGVDRAGAVPRRFLREGTHLPGLLLLRAGSLRPGLRREGPGLPGGLRALDRTAQLRGGAGPDGRWPTGRATADLASLRHRRGGTGLRIGRWCGTVAGHPAAIPRRDGAAGNGVAAADRGADAHARPLPALPRGRGVSAAPFPLAGRVGEGELSARQRSASSARATTRPGC